MYHGFAYDQHVDYAIMIWNDLIDVVNTKHRASKACSFVPFMRFLQLIVRHCIRRTPEIQCRDNLRKCPHNEMQCIMSHTDDPEITVLPIPLSMLKLIDRTDVDVQDYIRKHYPDYDRTTSPDHQSFVESAHSESTEDKTSSDEAFEGSENDSDDSSDSPDAPDAVSAPTPSQSPKDERRTKIGHGPTLIQPQPQPPSLAPIPSQTTAPITQTPSESSPCKHYP